MIKDYKSAIENIRTELRKYLTKYPLKSLVLGVSGGIDSALCAALAKPICDELNIALIGRSITILTNKPEEIERAKNIGNHFTSDFKEIDLSESFKIFEKMIIENHQDEDLQSYDFKIRLGNAKARTRMVYLYDLASKYKGMVLSTDNYTELLLGFWTLHGDVGDYGMIQQIWKTEVYEMSRFLASQLKNKEAASALLACVDAVPTDGLGITNSDLDQIGAPSYQAVDGILIRMVKESENIGDLENHKVIIRNRNSEFKRNNPFNIPRNLITDEDF